MNMLFPFVFTHLPQAELISIFRLKCFFKEMKHDVMVWNRSPAAADAAHKIGARGARTSREAAEGLDFVLSMVTDDTASQNVWVTEETGAIFGLGKYAIAVELSTISPEWIKSLALKIQTTGGKLVGTLPQAEAGQLIVFAGGEADDIEKAWPMLAAYACKVHEVGAVEQAPP